MSQDKNNPDRELVLDYSLKKSFVRLHLDVEVSWSDRDEVKSLMDRGAWDELGSVLIEREGAELKPFVDLFFSRRS